MAAKKKSPARKAAKKVPQKRVAKKQAKKPAKSAKKTTVRLEDPDKMKPLVFKKRFPNKDKSKVLNKMTVGVRASVDVLSERSQKRPVKLYTPAMLRRTLVPYDEIYFQHILDSIGFRTPSAVELVAPEGIGSTTWVWDFIGRLSDMGCYSIYIECEDKMMSDRRIKRLLDRDPKVATLKLNSVVISEARSLDQLDEVIRQTVKETRKRCDNDPETKGNPIFVFPDPWGALMSKGEAKGNSEWGLGATAKKEKTKDTTAGSNFEHAKHAQGMARWLPSFMKENNASVFFINKQNDKVDMTSSPLPSYMAPSPLKNDTRIGGRALKRLCGYRMTMLKLGDLREKTGLKRVYGYNVRMMMVKNSYGPRDRTCEFTILFDKHEDTAEYQAPGLTYANQTCAWMVARKFLGTTVERDLYTCDALGCVAVDAETLYAALKADEDNLSYIGSQLGIEGYEREVQHINPAKEEEEVAPPVEEVPTVPVDEPSEDAPTSPTSPTSAAESPTSPDDALAPLPPAEEGTPNVPD
tara:strand:- start:647 stop:2218 length:1572 start_codon:yes stop_codon:yes gene_type:complete